MEVSLRDIFRMAGTILIISNKVMLLQKLESDEDRGWRKDEWRKIPVKILMGGADWWGIILVNLWTAGKPWLKGTGQVTELHSEYSDLRRSGYKQR